MMILRGHHDVNTENGWGSPAEVPRLELKWAFGFPGDVAADAQPTIAGGRVFVGSQSGNVYSLSAATGCIHWFFQAPAAVRAAVSIGRIETDSGPRYAAFIGDRAANVCVALSDLGRIDIPNSLATEPDPETGGGMFALRLENGQRVWHTPPPACGARERCSPAQSAPVSAIPGVAFSGSVDGHLRGYATTNGAIVWDFDTVRPYETVNRVPARGGSLNVAGPAIGGGMLFVNSGYIANGIPGNVLLAFSVDGK